MRGRTGWQSLGEWALPLGLVASAFIAAMSTGAIIFPFALVAVALAARRNRAWPDAPMGRAGWQSLGEWALAFGLVAFAFIAGIGVFVFPFALVAVAVAARRNRAWPEAPMGALIGAGSVSLFVAYINLGSSPCPPGRLRARLATGEHFSCGGLDPTPWLIVGALLTAAGFVGYLVSRRTRLATSAA